MRVWCNGALIDGSAPAIAVTDHGFTVGDGVFEALKIVDGTPFALTRHLDRLAHSARGIGLPVPDEREIRDALKVVLDGQVYAYGRVRITYTAGISPLGSGRDTTSPTLVIAATESPPAPAEARAVVVPWPRNERGATVGLKTTSYADNVIALAYANEHGASEAIFVNTVGNLCEGTGSNVFAVFGNDVVTPPLSSGCLAGVSRKLLLEWSDAREWDVRIEDLAHADEIFLTSTTRDVQAVCQLDDHAFAVGPHTQELAALWREREALDSDP